MFRFLENIGYSKYEMKQRSALSEVARESSHDPRFLTLAPALHQSTFISPRAIVAGSAYVHVPDLVIASSLLLASYSDTFICHPISGPVYSAYCFRYCFLLAAAVSSWLLAALTDIPRSALVVPFLGRAHRTTDVQLIHYVTAIPRPARLFNVYRP